MILLPSISDLSVPVSPVFINMQIVSDELSNKITFNIPSLNDEYHSALVSQCWQYILISLFHVYLATSQLPPTFEYKVMAGQAGSVQMINTNC